ncbi:MAG TPA: class I SAM-dependent methyltransferase [Actinomycetota bacterium]|nr:class I SAM-dependent methyltransferase [Actinomycetota bacterium]
MSSPATATRGKGLLEGFLARRRCAMADRLIPSDVRSGSVLDIGCGSFPTFLDGTHFTERFGIDQVHPEAWVGLVPPLQLVTFDAESFPALPFRDASFDVVTMLAVLEHIEEAHLPRVLGEVRRVLRPGGRFVVTTPPPWTDRLLKVIARVGLVSKQEIEEHDKTFVRAELATLLASAGFISIEAGYFELGMNVWATAVTPLEATRGPAADARA